ncbi:MAG: glyoxalase/Bleomycin resistance/Dioxygenase superfamily protein [Paucimonas sp.]|nr:glyoxalase/Bleomycin resistance/Dioxygenase superfamily protein [Paucimonas sp.]
MILGFSHYNLRAPRPLLDELKDFYCEVVGLSIGARPPFRSFGYWLYAGGEALLHLSEAALHENRISGAVSSFDHVAFKCAGLKQAEGRLATLGIDYRISVVPQSGQVQIFFKDPAGNGIELNFAPESV